MFCPNCVAEYADWAHKCPYCGAVNEAVDEKLYMEHMNQLKSRLDHVDEESERAYLHTVSRSAKKTVRIVCIIAAVALVIVLLFVFQTKITDHLDAQYEQAAYEWQKEEFPKLDTIYEKRDYDGVIEEAYASTENNDFNAGQWAHYYFVFDFYGSYASMMQMKELYGTDDLDSAALGDGLYGAVFLYCQASDSYLDRLITSYKANSGCYGITEEERDTILLYRQEADDVLHNTLHFSDAEIEALYNEALEDDWLKLSVLKRRLSRPLQLLPQSQSLSG